MLVKQKGRTEVYANGPAGQGGRLQRLPRWWRHQWQWGGGRGRWRLGCMGEGREYGGHNKHIRQLGPARRHKVAMRVAWHVAPVRVARRRNPLKLCLPRAPTLVDCRGRARGTAVYMKHGRNILVNSYECQGKAWRWQTCRATRLHANTRKWLGAPSRRPRIGGVTAIRLKIGVQSSR